MTLRVLVVDDEAPARRKLRRMLADAGGVEVVGEAEDGPAAVRAIQSLRPDLVLLDIRMPGLDGFGVVAEVGPARMPPVVFVTAYDDFAVKAFEVQALDYLLKPATAERLRVVLDRARERLGAGQAAQGLSARLDALLARLPSPTPFLQRLLVEHNGRAQLVPVEQVDRIEAARNYVHLHVAGARLPLRQTLSALAERLDPAQFLRISRSEIVRLDAVKEFQTWFHGDYKVILKDGTELMWSRRYRAKSGSALPFE
jgi:two-component system, LytTR family, response regulator